MEWLKNFKILWGIISILVAGLIAFVIYNKSLIADIDILKTELKNAKNKIDIIENSELYQVRQWRWTIEEKLIRAGIIKIEAGIIQ